jgi:hypothetical protein
MYVLASMTLDEPSGVNWVSARTTCGTTSQPAQMPARNSGTAAAMYPSVYRRSLEVSPGVIKAHSW